VIRACVLGCAGPALSAEEAAFFRGARPWGFILFARNVEAPDQVRKLVADLRETVGRENAPVLIDQEGGRVQRLGPPHWRCYPPGADYGARGVEMARLGGRLIANDLAALGINVDCAPVLDLPAEGAHAIIGDRAFGAGPTEVATLARAMADGLLSGGVLPIVKHIPGHGRATSDSHEALPRVEASRQALESWDFQPFRLLADLPAAMTAHVVYTAYDPVNPATTSRATIDQAIRGAIGFDGLLISDDLEMKALTGSLQARAEASLAAGCDIVLQCHGGVGDMAQVVAGVGALEGRAAMRAEAALARLSKPRAGFDAVAEGRRFELAFAA
jgi:beta-N-acetylhexosaminidase